MSSILTSYFSQSSRSDCNCINPHSNNLIESQVLLDILPSGPFKFLVNFLFFSLILSTFGSRILIHSLVRATIFFQVLGTVLCVLFINGKSFAQFPYCIQEIRRMARCSNHFNSSKFTITHVHNAIKFSWNATGC